MNNKAQDRSFFLEMNTSKGKKMISIGSIAWAASVALLLFCQGAGATVVMSSARTQFGSNKGRRDIGASSSLASTASPEISTVRGGSAIGRHNAGPWGNFMRTIKEARRHLVAAGVARCVSITAMYPVDTIKVRTTRVIEGPEVEILLNCVFLYVCRPQLFAD
jgi:hypothetical protein